MHDVPVLLVIFNRPEKTRAVIDALKSVKPKRLFVAADGPRKDNPDDAEKCALARVFASHVDWDCDVKTRFLDENLGCGLGVSTGISWFFEHVDCGIILEDDCVPHPHFFQFCGELFERFADDHRIMRISGLVPYPARNWPFDYHFTRRFFCSGWGTWRRAWRHFSYTLDGMERKTLHVVLQIDYPYNDRGRNWIRNVERMIQGDLKTWAIRWDMACFLQNGLTISPEKNMITNIGFGEDATHTHRIERSFADLETQPFVFPLRHPPFVYPDLMPEKSLEGTIYRYSSLKSRLAWHVKRILGAVTDYVETLGLITK